MMDNEKRKKGYIIMNQEFYSRLEHILREEQILQNELMARHTTFRIGGPADYFLIPDDKEQVRRIIEICKEENMPYYIIGNGSNLLVSDKGYRGVVIQLYTRMAEIRADGENIHAQAGASLAKIAAAALREELTGFEFAAGIPGTLGGACIMNAGAYGGEMKDVLEEVTVLTKEGEIRVISKENLDMGYRTSAAAKNGDTVLEAVIKLEKGEKNKIQARMEELKEKRISKQPLEYPSAGSTFKRPEGYFAGKLIQDAGLRGYRIGGAMVSEKHCGFVINAGGATAADVDALIKYISQKVNEHAGVTLEPEVKRLGEF